MVLFTLKKPLYIAQERPLLYRGRTVTSDFKLLTIDPSYTMDRVNTLVTYMCPCGKSSPVSKQVMSLDTSPVLRWKIHSISSSEQKRSREEGEKGTKGHLPAKAADTLLSLKDGSVSPKMDHLPQINIDGDVTWTLKKTTSDQGLSSEGAETKDTIKMVEPIAQQTRCRVKLQRPSEPRMEAANSTRPTGASVTRKAIFRPGKKYLEN